MTSARHVAAAVLALTIGAGIYLIVGGERSRETAPSVAYTLLDTDAPIGPEVVVKLRAIPGVLSARLI